MTDSDGHAPKTASAELARLVRNFIGPAAEELGAAIGDQLRYYRWRSAQKILQRAEKYAADIGIPRREVPLKFLIPFIEKCSLEDEDSPLSDLWAHLLANAATGFNWKYAKYSEILSRIDGQDVQMLLEMFNTAHQSDAFLPERFSSPSWSEELSPRRLGDDFTRGQIAPNEWNSPGRWVFVLDEDDVANFNSLSLSGFDEGMRLVVLQSLGLVYVHSGIYLYGADHNSHGKRYFCILAELTPLGYDFVDSCQSDDEA